MPERAESIESDWLADVRERAGRIKSPSIANYERLRLLAIIDRHEYRITKLAASKEALIRENKRLADRVARLSPGWKP